MLFNRKVCFAKCFWEKGNKRIKNYRKVLLETLGFKRNRLFQKIYPRGLRKFKKSQILFDGKGYLVKCR